MGTWFVYCKDGERTGWIAGPYDSRERADAAVKPAMRLAVQADPWATFYERGVAKLAPGDAAKIHPVFGAVQPG